MTDQTLTPVSNPWDGMTLTPVAGDPFQGAESMAPGASAESESRGGEMGVQAWHPMLTPPPKAVTAPATGINWDRNTVGNGWSRQAIQEGGGPETTVIEAPVPALESAFKASNPNFYIAGPKQQVVDYAKSGAPMSVPEIGVVHGQLGFQNGRNRFAAARDMGAQTIPVAVETGNAQAVMDHLAKFQPQAPAAPAAAPSMTTLTPVASNPFAQ